MSKFFQTYDQYSQFKYILKVILLPTFVEIILLLFETLLNHMHTEIVRIEDENKTTCLRYLPEDLKTANCLRYLPVRLSEQNIDGRIISDTVLQPTCGSEGER
jgi:hypothetical protein